MIERIRGIGKATIKRGGHFLFANAVTELFDYSAWATKRVFDAASNLDNTQFLTDRPNGTDSIRNTLVHLVMAEWLWLERWRGTSPDHYWDPLDYSDIQSIRDRWSSVDRELRAYVCDLSDEDLGRAVSYVNIAGETWSYILWQQAIDLVNHGTQHRSEIALRLTELGRSPGDLDLLIYFDELAFSR
jgi:uncharacterized damage-inducible protein DinB